VYGADGAVGINRFLAVKPLNVPECFDTSCHRASRGNQDEFSGSVIVRVVGQIRAGHPNDAEETFEEAFPLPRHLVGGGDLFLLKVVGDSMIESAISDGDWVVVRQQPAAENGEIVAAMIGGEATVKTLKLVGGKVLLMPGNQAYAAIPGDEATILGKVVVVLRRL
jgi:repressor LexA